MNELQSNGLKGEAITEGSAPVDWDAFEKWSTHLAAWSAEYYRTLGARPVRAQTRPGEISA
ncbi:MAG: hypothetical protein AAF647_10480, partial [Pseudomonadota bacterium]